ncbi:hypothetical protein Hanom_Chr16g01487561 [Helianthus anomalus]
MPGHRLQTSEKLKQSFITIQDTKTSSLCQLQLTAKEAFQNIKTKRGYLSYGLSSSSTIWALLSAACFLMKMPHLNAALSLSHPTTAFPEERVLSTSNPYPKLEGVFGI